MLWGISHFFIAEIGQPANKRVMRCTESVNIKLMRVRWENHQSRSRQSGELIQSQGLAPAQSNN